jgi:hypothetical protein
MWQRNVYEIPLAQQKAHPFNDSAIETKEETKEMDPLRHSRFGNSIGFNG